MLATIGWSAAALLALAGPVFAQGGDLTLGVRVFPESATSTEGGDLITGSLSGSNIYVVKAGADTAEVWSSTADVIDGGIVLGVLVDGDTLWACVNGPFGSNVATLASYNLADASLTGTYPLPGGGLCNDIAVSPDGVVFITDTNMGGGPGRILSLVPDADGKLGFRTDLAGFGIGGIDGIAFVDGVLYGNNVSANELYRIDMDENGVSGMTTLTLSEPIGGPDGMRTLADGSGILLAENSNNRVSVVTFDGDNANIRVLADGYQQSVGVAQIGDTVYVVEGKFSALFDPSIDPGVFVAHAVPLGG